MGDRHVAQGWEQTARVMKEVALVRSLTNKEGNHQRAQYLLRLHDIDHEERMWASKARRDELYGWDRAGRRVITLV